MGADTMRARTSSARSWRYQATVLAVLGGISVVGARPHGAPLMPVQRTQPPPCMDEEGRGYSQGALRRVVDQMQICFTGVWTFDPSTPPKDPPPANAKSCHSERAADKGQEYSAGLLRAFDDSTGKRIVERCDDGTWHTVPGSR
jgi:hypothetical protein